MSGPQSREHKYAMKPEPAPAELSREDWDRTFADVHDRLVFIEAKGTELDEVLNELRLFGLERLDTAIVPLIEQTQQQLAELQQAVAQTIAQNAAIIENFQYDVQAALASLNSQIAAVEERVNEILQGGIPAGDVAESATRVFVTPAQRSNAADAVVKTPKVVTDWNEATETGFYIHASTIAGAPTTGAYFGEVHRHNANFITQEVWAYGSDGAGNTWRYLRSYDNGTWSAWIRLRVSEAELDARYQRLSLKNQPNGYAGLDADGKIPTAQTILVEDVFTTSGTWTKDPKAKLVIVEYCGPGGGGGGGSPRGGSSSRGPSGGTGGEVIVFSFPASTLGETEQVVIGANGLGGNPPPTDTGAATVSSAGGTSGAQVSFAGGLARGGVGGSGGVSTGSTQTSAGNETASPHNGGHGGRGGAWSSAVPSAGGNGSGLGGGGGGGGYGDVVNIMPGGTGKFGNGGQGGADTQALRDGTGFGGGGGGGRPGFGATGKGGNGSPGRIRIWQI